MFYICLYHSDSEDFTPNAWVHGEIPEAAPIYGSGYKIADDAVDDQIHDGARFALEDIRKTMKIDGANLPEKQVCD